MTSSSVKPVSHPPPSIDDEGCMCVFSSDRLEAELEQKRQDAVMKELEKRTRERAAKAAAAAKASADAALAANTTTTDMSKICSA